MPLFTASAPRLPSNIFRLQAGQSYVPPQGWYWYKGSRSASLQKYDPVGQIWRYDGDDSQAERIVYFDGQATRVANPTGCVVAVLVNTAGSGYTSPPTVTASAGSASFTAIVGGAISTAATIAAGGSGYLYPPLLFIEQPPSPGVQATGYITISNGTVSAVTIDQQGAGYLAAPNVDLINDPRDTVGSGGIVTVALTGAQTVTAVLVNNWGNPITSGTVPTLSFSGGGGSSAAALAVMDWTITSVSVTTPGAGYGNSAAVTVSGAGGFVTTAPAYLGTDDNVNLMRWRAAAVDVATGAAGGLGAVTIIDPGRYQSVPFPVITGAALITTAAVLALTMGGSNATIWLQPEQQ